MAMERDRVLQTFLELVRIPSPSRNERAVADYLKKTISALGYEVVEDGVGAKIGGNCGNLLVRVPATGQGLPALLLCAHMDTVETGEKAIEPRVDDKGDIRSGGDTIVGADDKTGVTALVELLRVLKEDKLKHGELVIAFTVAEEKEALGAYEMDPAVYKHCAAGVALDHSLPSEVIIGAPAKLAIHITVHGIGGHAAFPEQRINAAHVLAKTVSRLPSKRLDEFSTANLGIIRSGTAVNVIPGTAYAEYELRSHKDDLLDFHLSRVLTIIESSVREARLFVSANGGGIGDDGMDEPLRKATVEVDVISSYDSYRLTPESLPYRLLAQAVRATGQTFAPIVAQGGSDANIFNARGLPSAVLGCGMHGVHGVHERANLNEICRCVEVLQEAVTQGVK